jgi:hypothetical protein
VIDRDLHLDLTSEIRGVSRGVKFTEPNSNGVTFRGVPRYTVGSMI